MAKVRVMSHRKWRSEVLERDNHRCRICSGSAILQGHHIIVRCVGGKHILANGITYCDPCHRHEHGPMVCSLRSVVAISPVRLS